MAQQQHNFGLHMGEGLQHCLLCNTSVNDNGNVFYSRIREYVFSLVAFILLYIAAYTILTRYAKRRKRYLEAGDDKSSFPLALCAISLALSFGAILLVPFTILGTEINVRYPTWWYVLWLNKELIFWLWNNIFWGTNISLFLLIPFAFFYYEAEGIGGKGVLSRFYEAVIVFCLVSLIMGGLVYVLYLNVYDDDHGEYLLFSYSLISMLGSLLFLGCAPLGFIIMTSTSAKLRKPFIMRKRFEEQMQVLQFEKRHLTDKLAAKADEKRKDNEKRKADPAHVPLQDDTQTGKTKKISVDGEEVQVRIEDLKMRPHDHIVDDTDIESDPHESRLQELEKEVHLLKRKLSAKAFLVHNSLSLTLTLLNVLLTAYVLLRVSVKVFLWALTYNLASWGVHLEVTPETKASIFMFEAMPYGPASLLASLLECGVVIYLIIAAFVGLYSLPGLSGKFKPSPGNTSLRRLFGNTALILLISSSFPVVINILGVSSLDLMGSYEHTDYLRNRYFVISYQCLFVVAFLQSFRVLFHRFKPRVLIPLTRAVPTTTSTSSISPSGWDGTNTSLLPTTTTRPTTATTPTNTMTLQTPVDSSNVQMDVSNVSSPTPISSPAFSISSRVKPIRGISTELMHPSPYAANLRRRFDFSPPASPTSASPSPPPSHTPQSRSSPPIYTSDYDADTKWLSESNNSPSISSNLRMRRSGRSVSFTTARDIERTSPTSSSSSHTGTATSLLLPTAFSTMMPPTFSPFIIPTF